MWAGNMRAQAGRAVGAAIVVVAALAGGGASSAETAPARPTYGADGVVHVPAFDLPPSPYLSQQGVALQKMRATMKASSCGDIAKLRSGWEAQLAPQVQMTRARYPADIVDETIAGVPTRIITPKG